MEERIKILPIIYGPNTWKHKPLIPEYDVIRGECSDNEEEEETEDDI